MSQASIRERKFTARVVLLSLARNADQMAEQYEQKGQIQLSQQADRQAFKLYKALEEQESEETPEATEAELKTTLKDILELTDESKVLIEEALGVEEEHAESDETEEAEEGEDTPNEGDVPPEDFVPEGPIEGPGESDLPFSAALRPKATKPPVPGPKAPVKPTVPVPARKGYRIQAIR